MLPRNHPVRIQITFDDHRLVANAGLLRPTTLAQHLGLGELVDHHLDLGSAPGRANTGDKIGRLCPSWQRLHRRRRCAPRRWDSRCSRLQGQGAIHLGHFPAQLSLGPRPPVGPGEPGDCSGSMLARAWAAGAGPGDGPFTIDLDSTICETYGLDK